MTAGAEPVRAGTAERAALAVVGWIDKEHPRVGRFFLGLRHGGLRTLEPSAPLVLGAIGVGAATAAATSRLPARVRPPVAAVVPVGSMAAWLALWRWDALRWSRNRVSLVPGLAPDGLAAVVDALALDGVEVEVLSRRSPGGPVPALRCRIADLRRVNEVLAAAADGHVAGTPGAPTG